MFAFQTISDLATIGDGASIISRLINFPKTIRYCFNRYCKRNIKVAVYGASGVGKSQFLNTITNTYQFSTVRTRKLTKRELVLKSGRKIVFIDTPGHQSIKMVREKVISDIYKGKLDGIINVVNYGYNDGEDLEIDKAFKTGTNVVKQSYLSDNRRKEIINTKEFIEAITNEAKLKWVLTIVNKADIWYNDLNKVMEYYEGGDYGAILSKLSHATKIRTLPFCSLISPFANKPMTIIFGDKEKYAYFAELYDCLDSLVNHYKDV